MSETEPGPLDPAIDPPIDPAIEDVIEDAVPVRAELLPEEIAAGSDDPLAQAEAILAESEDRIEHPEPTIRRTAGEATTED